MSWGALNDYRDIKVPRHPPRQRVHVERAPKPKPVRVIRDFGNAAWQELTRQDEAWRAARS